MIYSFKSKSALANHATSYKDGVLYYTGTDYNLVAYDTNTGKVLWNSQVESSSPLALENVVITKSGSDGNYIGTIIDKKTGSVIDESVDNEYNVYPSTGNYYIKAYVLNKYALLSKLEVYNYDKELISQNTFAEEDRCYFEQIMTNGHYVISCGLQNKVYNKKSEFVMDIDSIDYKITNRALDIRGSFIHYTNILDTSEVSFLLANYSTKPNLAFYEDKVLEFYEPSTVSDCNLKEMYRFWKKYNQRTFLYTTDKNHENLILYNFLENRKVEAGPVKHLFCNTEFANGKYLKLRYSGVDEKKTIFYDKDLNKLDYEPTGYVTLINDEWVLVDKSSCSYNCNNDFYISNILTGEEKKINILITEENRGLSLNGNSLVSRYVVSADGIMTVNDNKLELYRFN